MAFRLLRQPQLQTRMMILSLISVLSRPSNIKSRSVASSFLSEHQSSLHSFSNYFTYLGLHLRLFWVEALGTGNDWDIMLFTWSNLECLFVINMFFVLLWRLWAIWNSIILLLRYYELSQIGWYCESEVVCTSYCSKGTNSGFLYDGPFSGTNEKWPKFKKQSLPMWKYPFDFKTGFFNFFPFFRILVLASWFLL